jgi:hypothetical protein
MNRREFIGVSVAALATVWGPQAHAAGRIDVIYVGGWD